MPSSPTSGAAGSRRIRIGVSACLLGEAVRWDGTHRRHAGVRALARTFELVPVCPEVEAGMGVPRPPVRLQRRGGRVRLVDAAAGIDHTAAMRRWAEGRLRQLEALDLGGFVLKSGSPSCGAGGVDLWSAGRAQPARAGRGLFAEALLERFPLLPVEEEGRLGDPALRRRFVERVLAYRSRERTGGGGAAHPRGRRRGGRPRRRARTPSGCPRGARRRRRREAGPDSRRSRRRGPPRGRRQPAPSGACAPTRRVA